MPPSSLEDEEGTDNLEHFEQDLDFLLRDLPSSPSQQRNGGGRALFDIQRSGSAPPTVEGSLTAVGSLLGKPEPGEAGGLLGEEEIRSHPAYLTYYYSNENLNPRLPPPLLSREDWRAARRFQPGTKGSQVGGGIGDWRKEEMGEGDVGSNSLFALQPGVSARDRERELRMMGSTQRNLAQRELTGIGLGARRKSFADVLQEELSQPTALPAHLSHATRQNSFGNFVNPLAMHDGNMKQSQNAESIDNLHSLAATSHLIRMQSLGSSASHSLASGGPSLPRSTTPDPQLIRRSPSPCLPPIGARSNLPSNGSTTSMANHGDIAVSLSGMNLTKTGKVSGENHGEGQLHQEFAGQSDFLFNIPNNRNHYLQQNVKNCPQTGSPSNLAVPMMAYKDLSKKNGILSDHNLSKLSANGQGYLSKGSSSSNTFTKVFSSGPTGYEDSNSVYNNTELPDMGYVGINTENFVNQKYADMTNNQLHTVASLEGGTDGQYLERRGNQVGQGFQVPSVDPLYARYLQRTDLAAQPALNMNDRALGRNYTDVSPLDMSYQKAYIGALVAQQKLQYGTPFLGKSTGLDHGHCGNAAYGLGLPYPTNSLSSNILSSPCPGNPLWFSERLSRFPSLMKNPTSGSLGPWTAENGIKETRFGSSFLEEFKNSKTRSFELSEIVGHVVEFSADQYGSRFIQQKLETASVEEKNKIFPEILPHARALMTDVFGNYVIQKFFEYGTKSQRTQLANQLKGHVLALSLQMYGCRVIQKALEVVDEDEQTHMVSELDGSVIKCVRDQNGNHVIQKCIECVPQEKIQFIITTFYGQVVALSTHPYGCRVIQRVLENCDVKTQSIMMKEILQSVTTLALDQYGNYVVQHVLQHGKAEERTAIISTLAGQIVNMSQQKFASNVVEKCLTYGTAEERQLLINEMLGSTDENEPLQAMMKDQFGNYVVQKVLDLCDDQNRELILSRIKIHLTVLKRFTYGKHIVARVEKLVTNEERRMGISSYSS